MISDKCRLSSASLVNCQYTEYLLNPALLSADAWHLLAVYLGVEKINHNSLHGFISQRNMSILIQTTHSFTRSFTYRERLSARDDATLWIKRMERTGREESLIFFSVSSLFLYCCCSLRSNMYFFLISSPYAFAGSPNSHKDIRLMPTISPIPAEAHRAMNASPLVAPFKVRRAWCWLRPVAMLPSDLQAQESDQATLQRPSTPRTAHQFLFWRPRGRTKEVKCQQLSVSSLNSMAFLFFLPPQIYSGNC